MIPIESHARPTVSVRRQKSSLLNPELFYSRHGLRWKFWDFVVGMVTFAVGFYVSPHYISLEAAETVSRVMPNELVHTIPRWYFMVIAGGVFGFVLATACQVCGVPVPERRSSNYELATTAGLAIAGSTIVFFALLFLYRPHGYGRIIVITAALGSYVLIFLPRYIMQHLIKLQPINVILYGAGDAGGACLKRIKDSPFFSVQGYLDANGDLHRTEHYGAPVVGNIQDFESGQIPELACDVVVICVAQNLEEENAQTLLKLPMYGVEVLNMGAFIEFYFKEVTLDYDCPYWLASSRSVPGNASIFVAKRLLDIVGSGIGLLLTAPFWPLVALAIKLDSKGPVFFKQTRVGRFGRNFDIIKFRTMRTDAEKDGPKWATQDDPRVTKLGRFLRKSRIDELPQLWNVFVGQMSLVGPRPERPEFVQELQKDFPLYARRHLVPPGLTGWAQIRYRYGASKEDAKRKLEYELYYIRHLSIIFDLEIIFKTVPMLMKGSR